MEWMRFEAGGSVTAIVKSVPTLDGLEAEAERALNPLVTVLIASADLSAERAELLALEASGAAPWLEGARRAAVKGEPLTVEQEQALGDVRQEAERLAAVVADAVRQDPQNRAKAAVRALRRA